MRNLPGRARAPGCQQLVRKPSLAQDTDPDNPGSNPHPAHMRWLAPSLGLRLAVECGWIYHIRPCLRKRSGTSHRMLRRKRVGEASPFSSGPLLGPLRKLGGSRLNLKAVTCQTYPILQPRSARSGLRGLRRASFIGILRLEYLLVGGCIAAAALRQQCVTQAIACEHLEASSRSGNLAWRRPTIRAFRAFALITLC